MSLHSEIIDNRKNACGHLFVSITDSDGRVLVYNVDRKAVDYSSVYHTNPYFVMLLNAAQDAAKGLQ
jgi:hypothetical protein